MFLLGPEQGTPGQNNVIQTAGQTIPLPSGAYSTIWLLGTAVQGAQQEGGIQVDGVVGLQTWALPIHADGQVLANLCGVPGPGSN